MLQHWWNKFYCAFRGVWIGVSGHSSFWAHIPATIAVLAAAIWLNCTAWQWAVLGLCIGLVWSLELLNSSIEHLARGLCAEHNEEVGKALDTASAAVLLFSMTAAGVGLSILGYQLYQLYWGFDDSLNESSHVKQEMADVTVLQDIGFALCSQFASVANLFFALVGFQVL